MTYQIFKGTYSPCYTPIAANVMESLLLNSICVNLIGIYCFWSYVQLRNEILLISSVIWIIVSHLRQQCCHGVCRISELSGNLTLPLISNSTSPPRWVMLIHPQNYISLIMQLALTRGHPSESPPLPSDKIGLAAGVWILVVRFNTKQELCSVDIPLQRDVFVDS